jgi:hypothetical protein
LELGEALLQGFQAGQEAAVLVDELETDPVAQGDEQGDDQPGQDDAEKQHGQGYGRSSGVSLLLPIIPDRLMLCMQ